MPKKETTREKAKRLQKVEDTYVTGLQAAEIKGVSPKAIYEAIASGRLIAARIGGRHMINRKDLDAWVIIGHRRRRSKRLHPWMKLPEPEEVDEE